MDTAKALRALVASFSQQIYDLAGVNKIALPGPFLCCVSTTSGSAAELAGQSCSHYR